MSSKIKGGGRAILSSESQQSLIDLLYSLEQHPPQDDVTDDYNDNSDDRRRQHEKKEQLQKKKFVKRLVRRHELRQLRQQFHGAAASTVDNASEDTSSIAKVRKEMSSISLSTPTAAATTSTSSPNVRIELAEAIFIDDKQKKKSNNKKESKKKDDKKKNKKRHDDGNLALFKIGAKKVAVLSRSTTIKDLLKQSKSKLKLKKSPIRAFVQPNNDNKRSLLFDLEHDLSGVVDGTVVYVTVTAKSIHDDDDDDHNDNKKKSTTVKHDKDEEGIVMMKESMKMTWISSSILSNLPTRNNNRIAIHNINRGYKELMR